ncbi:choline O-acetyltransferase-like [Babylonia areolata]|uniref:choline O-acetyltransferase-like n=1 Tax=Babylonia areolata TaxID=304850 RepID=UPI003FD55B83
MSTFTVCGVGKKMMKGWGLSPDAFIQLALQLAYYRIHHRPSVAVEYVSKRCHPLGRLDNVRSTTPQALQFLRHMDSSDVSPSDKLQWLKEASDAHTHQVKEVMWSYSTHSHLKALQYTAHQFNYPVPPFFLDTSYRRAFQFHVNSSQVPHEDEMYMCYPSEAIDGYSCPYIPHHDHVNFNILSMPGHLQESSSQLMASSLLSALDDMSRLCRHRLPDRV